MIWAWERPQTTKAMETYDWIVLGGGAAGLSLVHQMMDQNLSGSILLLEQAPKTENDRTWCYWHETDLAGMPPSAQTWQKGIIQTDHTEKRFEMNPQAYRLLRAADFYDQMYEAFRQSPRVTVRYERVVAVEGGEAQATVKTEQQIYRGNWVFNSLLPFAPIPESTRRGMKQHFVGYWIETENDTFEANTFRMMDFRVPQDGGVQFVYVLPFTSRRALVEYTVFSNTPWPEERYRSRLNEYLQTQYGLEDFSITGKESGVIPMSSDAFRRVNEKRVVQIGTAGGLTKASTGFTFHRVQEDSVRLVRDLIVEGRPFPVWQGTGRFAFYDRLLLWLIQHQPERVPDILLQLFAHNPAPRAFRFLAEKTTLLSEIRLFFTLPWPPFLKALWHVFFQTQSPQPLGSLAQPDYAELPAA